VFGWVYDDDDDDVQYWICSLFFLWLQGVEKRYEDSYIDLIPISADDDDDDVSN
jgi:hypothetical protein